MFIFIFVFYNSNSTFGNYRRMDICYRLFGFRHNVVDGDSIIANSDSFGYINNSNLDYIRTFYINNNFL